ncbi:MAG: hypothetical protein R3Y44_05955 [Rikenellaceae bacterium]
MEIAVVISKYLESNRRLVVPQLGAFLVKEPNHDVLFSQLLTRDDGVLHALLLCEGATELEATGMMQRLLFDVRYVIANGGEFVLVGVGRFTLDESGALHFESHFGQSEEEPFEPETQEDPEVAADESETVSDEEVDIHEEEHVDDEPSLDVVVDPVELSEKEDDEFENQDDIPAEKIVVGDNRVSQKKVQPRGRFEPDPDLEGLSYGGAKGRRTRRRSGVDWWLVIGVSAVVLALGVILYGFLREGARNSYPISLYEYSDAE